MQTMRLPGFAADASIYPTLGHYRAVAAFPGRYGVQPQQHLSSSPGCFACEWFNGACQKTCIYCTGPGPTCSFHMEPCNPSSCPPPPLCPPGCFPWHGRCICLDPVPFPLPSHL
jgi:hypothetical protein